MKGKIISGKNRLQWKLKLKLHQPQSSFLKVTNFSEEKPLVKRSAFCFSDSTFLRTKGWSFFTVGSMLKKFLTKWHFTAMCLVLGESCGALQVAMHPLLSSHTFDFTKDSLFSSFSKPKHSVTFSKARHKGTKVLIA